MDILSILIILMSICIAIIVFFSLIVFLYPGYDGRGFDKKGNHKNGTRYDDKGFDFKGYNKEGYTKSGFDRNGYDRQGYDYIGYNRKGYNREGKYDRYFDVDAFSGSNVSTEGFYDPHRFEVGVTDHARERFAERMEIISYAEMDDIAEEAYRHGKTKRQLGRKEAEYMIRKGKMYPDKTMILYDDFYFVFSQDNSLVTLFPKEHEDNYYDYSRYYR